MLSRLFFHRPKVKYCTQDSLIYSFFPFSTSVHKGTSTVKLLNNNLELKMGSRDTILKGWMKKALCFLYLGQDIKPEKREKGSKPWPSPWLGQHHIYYRSDSHSGSKIPLWVKKCSSRYPSYTHATSYSTKLVIGGD